MGEVMILKKMVLVGAKGLMLNNIHTFTYLPSDPYQLILGTNGSGKSTVLREITPLPAVPANFQKNGSKYTEWEHRNSQYVLFSNFKGGARHSFIKDNEELNPGGTAAIYRELVLREFGVTSEIHKVLTGGLLFTDMSPSKKREWITSMCDTDFSFALKLHGDLSRSLRDLQGHYKVLGERLTTETSNLLALETNEDLDATAAAVRNELDVLFSSRGGATPSTPPSLDQALAQVERLGEALLTGIPTQPSGANYTSLDDVVAHGQALTTEVTVKTALLDQSTHQYHELETLQQTLIAAGSDGIESLTEQAQAYQAELDGLDLSSGLFPEQPEALSCLEATNDALPQLVEIFTHLPDNSDRRFTGPLMVERKAELKALNQKLDSLAARTAKTEADIEHLEQAQKTECPSCHYVWVPGFSDHRLAQLRDSLVNLTADRDAASAAQVELESYIEQAQEYAVVYNQFKALVRSYPKLQVLWDWILDNNAQLVDPRSWIPRFYEFQRDVSHWAHIQEVRTKLQGLEHALETASKLEGTTHLGQQLERLQQQISDNTDSLVASQAALRECRKYHRLLTSYLQTHAEFEAACEYLLRVRDEHVTQLRVQGLTDAIVVSQDRLGGLQRRINQKLSLQAIVIDLETNRAEVELNTEAYRLLTTELSPTEGLIAEQLRGFIGSFAGHLNSIINQVWTYELTVLPCRLESGELDYVFPLQVRSDQFVVDDAREWSDGQRAIVNLAFVLVVMFYLKLNDHPLLLDELGRDFDEQHRFIVMNFVKSLIDTGGFNQMFLISHYASAHGGFTSAEVLVMDAANIATPAVYNTHVEFA